MKRGVVCPIVAGGTQIPVTDRAVLDEQARLLAEE